MVPPIASSKMQKAAKIIEADISEIGPDDKSDSNDGIQQSVMNEVKVSKNIEPRQLRRKSMTARKLYETTKFIADASPEVEDNISETSSESSSSSNDESDNTE